MIRMIMMAKWYSGNHVDLKLPDMSYRLGKPPKKPHPGNLSRPGIEHGPAAWQTRMIPPPSPSAVDRMKIYKLNILKLVTAHESITVLNCKSTAVEQVVACALVTQRDRFRSPVGISFLGEVFRGFSSPVRQMSGRFRPTRSPNIIWPS